jgi:prepilin-type N-terminal cleavage/methylation domain-containing protein
MKYILNVWEKNMKKGFTLIELLIVVAIIGILAAIAVPNFLNAQMKAKISRVKADFKAVSTGFAMYQLDNNVYPPDFWGPCEDVNAYKMLTTPVAYMSSVEAFRDYFTNESASGAVGAACAKNYYDYGMVDYITQSGVGYVVISFGPDLDLDMPWSTASMDALRGKSNAQPGFLYMSSNGLISSGDMILTAMRIHID